MRRILATPTLVTLAACVLACATGVRPTTSATRSPELTVRRVIEFAGACDASGAVALDETHIAVADDEDNVIRIYDADRGGEALASIDLSTSLTEGDEEADFEAATEVGGRAFWLASHSRSKKGKHRPSRLLFLATEMPREAGASVLVGTPYTGLLEALIADPRYAPFGLDRASERAPKVPGGLNIEGMTEAPSRGVLIGFRNPTPGERALLFFMANPNEVIERGAPPELSDPILLDLGRRGVRGLSSWRGEFLIAAGAPEDGPSNALYRWSGPGTNAQELAVDLAGFNPEGFFTPEGRDELMLLSDDGTRSIDEVPCKRSRDPGRKRFRGIWLEAVASESRLAK